MPLITVDELKLSLGLTGTSEDEYLEQLVGGVSASVSRFIGRNLEARTGVTEYHSGNGRERLYLKNRPVTALTSVHVDQGGYFGKSPNDPFNADTLLTDGVDFVCESNDADESNQSCLIMLWGGARFGGGTWLNGVGNIKVVYNCGYSTIPADVKQACFMIAAALRKQRKAGVTYSSESLGSYSYSLLTGQGNPGSTLESFLEATGLLSKYREWVL